MSPRYLQAVALSLALAGAAHGLAEEGFTAEVSGGRISGKARGEGAVFVGIPFARPPVGPLRWRPPEPAEPWTGVRDATSPSFDALQPDDGAWNHPMIAHSSEDCLYLNVLAPRWPAQGRLPVIVFIHGGGNFAGGAWEHLAQYPTLQDQGVVLVTVNYRLGVFGFFAHPGLTAESPNHASGNYALQDLVASLRWVKGNIAGFGGDPGNVKLMGQSAGALDILLLMACDEARGLFNGAIVESAPGVGAPQAQSLIEAEAAGQALAASLGAADIGALRAVPADRLLAAAESRHLRGKVDVDGWMLRKSPASIFASGEEDRVPMLIGTNARESSFAGSARELREAVAKRYGPLSARALNLYGLSGAASAPDPLLGDAGAQFLTDTTFRLPSLLAAGWHAAAGGHVWMYLFSETPKGREAFGPSHSSELAYTFGELAQTRPGVEYSGEDKRISDEMMRYWARFALTGDPNAAAGADWPGFGTDGHPYLEFKAGRDAVGRDLRGAYLDLFREDYEAKMAGKP